MKTNYKVAIVDDEANVRAVIEELIHQFCPDLNVCGVGESVDSAYSMILKEKPDLVLLDVEMPGKSGFELLKMFDTIDFKVIFITAYDQYAIKAIKYSAIDYIVKPIKSTEFVRAINKFRQEFQFQKERLNNFSQSTSTNNSVQKIAVPSVSRIQYVEINKIIHCEAEGSYTYLFLTDDKKIVSTRSIKEYEEMLEKYQFYRAHRSHLINLRHVNEYKKGEIDTVVLKGNYIVQFSRKHRTPFLEAMQKLG